jgi:hypothetical protein
VSNPLQPAFHPFEEPFGRNDQQFVSAFGNLFKGVVGFNLKGEFSTVMSLSASGKIAYAAPAFALAVVGIPV